METRADLERLLGGLESGRSPYSRRDPSHVGDLSLRLTEASSWCERHFDPARPNTCLRPPQLAPPVLCTTGWSTVDAVVAHRRLAGPGRLNHSGRPLVYYPDAQLSDGAAEAASSGFFAVHNAPAWATWVGYFQDHDGDHGAYLLAWVPSAALDLAQAGIDVNPEECICWLEDSDAQLRPVVEALLAPPDGSARSAKK